MTTQNKTNSPSKNEEFKYTNKIKIADFGKGVHGDLFVRLTFLNEGKNRSIWIPVNDLVYSKTEVFKRINRAGSYIVSRAAQNELINRIQLYQPKKINMRIAEQTGWFYGYFILGHKIIAKRKGSVAIALPAAADQFTHKYKRRGKIGEVNKLLDLAHGNTRWMMTVSLTALGPLADLIGQPQVAIQLTAGPATGKSTILIAAGSIWGGGRDHRGFSESWDVTENGIEPLAAAHSGTFLPLDETNSAPNQNGSRLKSILAIIFRMDNNTGKIRFNSVDSAKWWMGILSTSNKSLDEMAREENFPIKNQHRHRLIDVFQPKNCTSMFENLHGYPDVTEFAERVHELAATNYGILSRLYLKKLAQFRENNQKELIEFLKKEQSKYEAKSLEIYGSHPELDRLRSKFGLIYAAGALLVYFKLVPWGYKELLNAILSCETSHIEHVKHYELRGSSPNEILTTYIVNNRKKFRKLNPNMTNSMKKLAKFGGFTRENKNRPQLIMSAERFRSFFSDNEECNAAKLSLAKAKILLADNIESSNRRFVKKINMGVNERGEKVRDYVHIFDLKKILQANGHEISEE